MGMTFGRCGYVVMHFNHLATRHLVLVLFSLYTDRMLCGAIRSFFGLPDRKSSREIHLFTHDI